jgi:L-aspartate oxidase
MWNYVGIVRTDKRLARAQRRLDNLGGEIQEYYWGYLVDRDLLELRNLAEVARLIVACAQERKESRGLHYTLSYTGNVAPRDTVLVRGKPAGAAWPR